MKTYPKSELTLNAKNQVYHLGLSPEQISDKIILVGDQDRVNLVSSLFDSIDHQSQHREFVCHTGMYNGKKITALSTGIGTDNIDITINELDALVNIDLINRTDLPKRTTLNLVRIGTCGILQPEIPVHAYVLSKAAFGLDNVAHFYKINFHKEEISAADKIKSKIGLPSNVNPYFVYANQELTKKLSSDKVYEGITVTSSGFYGPQGRQLRLATKTTLLNDKLQEVEESGMKVLNFEMESSTLFSLGRELGHHCTTICLGVANRPNLDFSRGYKKEMIELIRYVLDRI